MQYIYTKRRNPLFHGACLTSGHQAHTTIHQLSEYREAQKVNQYRIINKLHHIALQLANENRLIRLI